MLTDDARQTKASYTYNSSPGVLCTHKNLQSAAERATLKRPQNEDSWCFLGKHNFDQF